MKMVYTAVDPVQVGHLRSILESEQIGTLVKNEHLTGGIGELPAVECWPEIWVVDPRDHERAECLVSDVEQSVREAPVGTPWRCPHCDEQIDPQFTDCWRCSDNSLLA